MKHDILLRSEKIVLRAHRPSDIDRLSELRNDYTLQRQLLSRPRPNSGPAVKRWLERQTTEPNTVFFVIATHPLSKADGFIQLSGIDSISGVAELGIALLPDARGRQLGSRGLNLLEQYAVDIMNIRKIHLRVAKNNASAIRLYSSSGYNAVGTHKRHFYQGGRYHDVILMEKFLKASRLR